MALFFLDTSALIKKYVVETGSTWVQKLISGNSIAVSAFALVEVASALGRQTREGNLTDGQRDAVFGELLADLPSYIVVRPSQPVLDEAARLAMAVPVPLALRAADALQLASARRCFQRWRRSGHGIGRFVCADRALVGAARWAGLSVDNPEDYP